MDITIGEAIIAQKAIEDVATIKMPAKVSYRLGRINDKLMPIKTAYEKTRNDLVISKYGTPVEDKPDSFQVAPDKLQDYLTEINSVLMTVETIDAFQVAIDDFGDVELPPEFFSAIKPFMVD
jgi:hypothetical protein